MKIGPGSRRPAAWCDLDHEHPFAAGGAYVNFMMEEGQERIRASYRDNYERLAAVKAKYDPTNLFRVNQNVPPVAAVAGPQEGMGAPTAGARRR